MMSMSSSQFIAKKHCAIGQNDRQTTRDRQRGREGDKEYDSKYESRDGSKKAGKKVSKSERVRVEKTEQRQKNGARSE